MTGEQFLNSIEGRDRESIAKDFLRLVRLAEERAEPEMERLRTMIDRAGYGTGQKEAQRISGSSQRSRVECNVCAKIDLENEILKAGPKHKLTEGREAILNYAQLRYEAMAVIRLIPRPIYAEVLYLYYIEALTWEEVARTVKRSLRSTFRVHGYALEVFDKVWSRYIKAIDQKQGENQ